MVKDAITELVFKYEAPSMADVVFKEINIDISHASGMRVWSEDESEFIDLTAGSGVHCLGHNHPEVLDAIINQLKKVTHTGWQFPTFSRVLLLEKLRELLPFEDPQFIFSVTGSEAVESALKVARLAKGRPSVLSFQGGFHGKTGGSLSVTSNPTLRSGVSNVPGDTIRLPYPEDEGLRKFIDCPSVDEYVKWIRKFIVNSEFPLNQIAGIIVEPIQGSSGMIAAPPNFLKAIRQLTQENDLLMIVDEIFSGMGRTGKTFGFEHDEIIPDIVIMGKSLGGGLPISLVAAPSSIMRYMPPYKQTSTFSATPAAAAAGVTILDILKKQKIAQNAEERGRELTEKLLSLNQFLDDKDFRIAITGRGLMLGLHIMGNSQDQSKEITIKFCKLLKENKIICLQGGSHGNVIKITPPLNITTNDVEEIFSKFTTAFISLMER